MKKSRYTEEQIAFALKQAETGTPVAEVLRRMGISEQTFYRWKKLYGGLGTGELRRLRQLEDDGRRLRALTVVDAYTRGALVIEVDKGIKGEQVVEVMTRIATVRGAPRSIRVDNGRS